MITHEHGLIATTYEPFTDTITVIHHPDNGGYTYDIDWHMTPEEAVEIFADRYGFDDGECYDLAYCIQATQRDQMAMPFTV